MRRGEGIQGLRRMGQTPGHDRPRCAEEFVASRDSCGAVRGSPPVAPAGRGSSITRYYAPKRRGRTLVHVLNNVRATVPAYSSFAPNFFFLPSSGLHCGTCIASACSSIAFNGETD